VFVVDDKETVRRFFRVTLSSQGYLVIEQSSGQEGISSTATEKPDVIILDPGRPDIDGVEVRDSESDKIEALDGWSR
jgi:two-component system, OmpR family, KDP operon response regulator KdpE